VPTIVGVRLRFAPKVLSFDPAGTSPLSGDLVIVETERGSEIGIIAEEPHEVPASELVAPLKPVLRIAGPDDIERANELEQLEREAMPAFRELVKKHGLDMKPVRVEYLFDGSKIIFYFSAEERVDFRELVRELAAQFKARIDMRQVGVRDEARMVGGIGHCGQPLCCTRFPGDFQPVSIRMAKEQDLPLNPLKISGLCGRLMCCLRYEYDAYKDYKARAPKRRASIETPLGPGKVADLNTPRETVTIKLEDGQRFTVPLCSMECGPEGGRPCAVSHDALVEVGAIVPAFEPAPSEQERPAGEQRAKRRRKSGSSQASGDQPKAGGSAEKRGDARRSGQKKAGSEGRKTEPARSGSGQAGGEKKPAETGGSQTGRRRRRRRPPRSGGENGTTQA